MKIMRVESTSPFPTHTILWVEYIDNEVQVSNFTIIMVPRYIHSKLYGSFYFSKKIYEWKIFVYYCKSFCSQLRVQNLYCTYTTNYLYTIKSNTPVYKMALLCFACSKHLTDWVNYVMDQRFQVPKVICWLLTKKNYFCELYG